MTDASTGSNIFLIGFSGTGKSAVAPKIAAALGWGLCDTDAEIARAAGKSIADIFARDGEERFRALERQALEAAARLRSTVISAGGGAPVSPENRALMHRSGMVALLEARPETIYRRLQSGQEDAVSVRPLLQAPDPLRRIIELKQSRQEAYATADWTVHTDDLSPEEVAQEVVRGWRYWVRSRVAGSRGGEEAPAAVVVTSTQSYPVFVGWGILGTIGKRMAEVGLSGTAYVISDETVAYIYGERMERFLDEAGFDVHSLALPAGESAKTMASVAKIYDFLVRHHAERRDAIVALGGGVVGDIAGLAAATCLRGMAFVQVPTTLVAMVDASIGGKVGVDHPRGKNLIGAFHQPRLVLADAQLLTTLDRRELSAGWAELVKHGFVLDSEFLDYVEGQVERLRAVEEGPLITAISRSAALKAAVVSEDERETAGKRTILNYGHSIGHGIEAATRYQRYLHGEAVAIGMVGAAMLGQHKCLIGADLVARHRDILERFGLPVRCEDAGRNAVLRAMKLDKKTEQGKLRWVLLEGPGKAVVRSDVPHDLVREVLGELGMK